MDTYDLVFEGGGAKGMVFVGALQAFEAQGYAYDRLLGTSAGAITATVLAAGYTAAELAEALNEKENGKPVFASFMSPPLAFDEAEVQSSATLAMLKRIDLPFVLNRVEAKIDNWLADALMNQVPNLFALIERGGWFSAHKFLEWMRRKLDEGTLNGKPRNFSGMTLKEFYTATNRELSMVVSDTVGGRMLVLNHRTTPDLPVVWGVRMSMSIPLVWPEVEWQAKWGNYHLGGKEIELTGNRMVDGGLLSNFPIELFLSDERHIAAVMGEKKNEKVLGFLIDEGLDVAGATTTSDAKDDGFDFSQLQMVQRLNRLVDTATRAHDKAVIDAVENSVVRLPAKGYGTTEFDMSDARRHHLIDAGRTAMETYFKKQAEQELNPSISFGAPEGGVDVLDYANGVATRILNW